jgi:hypothetical protein
MRTDTACDVDRRLHAVQHTSGCSSGTGTQCSRTSYPGVTRRRIDLPALPTNPTNPREHNLQALADTCSSQEDVFFFFNDGDNGREPIRE